MNPRNFVQSLSRGLFVLSLLAESSVPLSLTELTRRLKFSTSAMKRLTHTLQHLEWLERDSETKKFRLGSKALALAFSVMRNLELRRVCLPFMEEASREVGQMVNLAMLDEGEIVYLERIKTSKILNINLHVGSRLPAHCTSLGKVMLAFLPQSRLEEILGKIKLASYTPQTMTHKDDLRRELRKVKTRGFAINNEELAAGVRSVAAPIRNFSGSVIAAVNIVVLSLGVLSEQLETTFAKKVIETAHRISSALGYRAK